MAFLTACHMFSLGLALLAFTFSVGTSVVSTQLHTPSSHGLPMGGEGKTHHVLLLMVLFYTSQSPSENLSYSRFTSCSFITSCFWGKSICSFFSNHFPIKNIHFRLYSHSKFSFFFMWWQLRVGQEGKELLYKIHKFACALKSHCCLLSFLQSGHKDHLELGDATTC